MIPGLGNLARFAAFKIGVRSLYRSAGSKVVFFNLPLPLNFTMHNLEFSKNSPLKIGTHNQVFHCDEVLACYMLLQLKEFSNSIIVRTRDESLLKDCDIVVDVGGVYDKTIHRYDHHQREFKETFSSLRPEFGEQWTVRLVFHVFSA